MKRGFIIDSTLAISLEAAKKDGIEVVPLSIVVNDKTYKDLVEITTDEFYQEMENNAETTTSQPSAGMFLEMYEKLKAEGVKEIFVFTLSSKLSGTYQSATMASEMIDGVDIHVVDTMTASAVVQLIVRELMTQTDKTAAELVEYAKKAIANTEFYAYLGDFTRLKKGGRLSASQAMIGTLLKINLIFNLDGGGVNVFAKERKASNAIKRIMQEIADKKASGGKLRKLILLETNRKEFREKLEVAYKQKFPEETMMPETYVLSPVLGSHTGPEVAAVVIEWE